LARAEVKIKVDVVLGPGYQHHASLREMKYKRALDVTFHEAPPNLVDLIAAADLAIGSPGHTSWERCSLGLPALLITQAKNQEKVGQFMQLNGAAELLGTSAGNTEPLLNHHLGALLHDPSLLHKMSHSAYHLVDAQGPARVADCMLGLTLRPTEIGDAKMIFGWINDPTTRKQSMQHRPVELGSHIEWLSNALQDKARRLLIAEVDGQPVGQCRFDSIGAQVRISFLVSPAYRGRRIARPMLNAAILLNDLEGELRAEVRTGNLPSLAVFRGLLFSEGSPDPAGTIIFTRAQIQP
jgi:GNAT superfamily N-acetyltransferase